MRHSALLSLTLFAFVSFADADELAITSGGRRIIDRDLSTAATNCIGWTYAPSPVVDDAGNVVAMYTASDQLTHHCDFGIQSGQRFGDSIRRHELQPDGAWSAGINVIDRNSFPWMSDPAFLADHPETFVGHVTSPSVVRADGRYYMTFVASVDDVNLCAGEHGTDNPCGSCREPWSYFAAMWAVSDDGVNWRVKERAPGDAAFLGRAPDAADRDVAHEYKGIGRVSMVEHQEGKRSYFYIAAQYWSRTYVKTLMFRIERDPASEWGIAGTPQLWSWNRAAWIECEDGRVPDSFSDTEYSVRSLQDSISSISRTRIFGDEAYIAMSSVGSWITTYPRHISNSAAYSISRNLIDWTPGTFVRSDIRDFADGFSYDASVIDPVVVDGPGRTLQLFFASADGDAEHGIDRDGRYDCYLDPNIGATASYVGTGIYESTIQWAALRRTILTIEAESTVVVAGEAARFNLRVTAADGSTPEGTITLMAGGSGNAEVRPRDGRASIDLIIREAGELTVWANFYSTGMWLPAYAQPVALKVIAAARRRAVRR